MFPTFYKNKKRSGVVPPVQQGPCGGLLLVLGMNLQGPERSDTIPPSAPIFDSPVISESAIDLSWSASIDNVGVASYSLEVSTDNATWSSLYSGLTRAYSHTSLAEGVTYYYRVRATDVNGNVGEWGTTTGTIVSGIMFATNFGNGVYIDGSTAVWTGNYGNGRIHLRGGDIPGYQFPIKLWGGRLDNYEYSAIQVIGPTSTSTPFVRCDVNETNHPHQDHGLYDINQDLYALNVADRPSTGTASALKTKFVTPYPANQTPQTQLPFIIKPGGNTLEEQSGGFLYFRYNRKWEQDCFDHLAPSYSLQVFGTKTQVFNMTFTDESGILRTGSADWRVIASLDPQTSNPTPSNPTAKVRFRVQVANNGYDFPQLYKLWEQSATVPIFPDTWHNLEFAYRFSPNSDGFVWMAIDGTTAFSRTGATIPVWTGQNDPPRMDRVFPFTAYQTDNSCPRPLTFWTTDFQMFTSWPSDATTPHPT